MCFCAVCYFFGFSGTFASHWSSSSSHEGHDLFFTELNQNVVRDFVGQRLLDVGGTALFKKVKE
jgi:hypothetical protein